MQSLLKSYWTPVLLASFLILLMVMIYLNQPTTVDHDKPDIIISQACQDSLHNLLSDCFTRQQLSWHYQGRQKDALPLWKVSVPKDVAIPMIHLEVKQCVESKKAQILYTSSDPTSRQLLLHVGWSDSVFFHIVFHHIKTRLDSGKIALLIDDFGDRWDKSIESFCYLGGKISVSVLPGRSQSVRVAQEMKKRGCDVLLHLPMQPKNNAYRNHEFMISSDLNQAEIQDIVHRAIQEVPGVMGVNNHMGSHVTENHKIMRFILEVVQAHNLYFIDSRTTPRSVAYDVARELNMPCARKDVFIDNTSDKSDIRKWLYALADLSQKKGVAIGIGHCHQGTLEVLREEVPKLQSKGFRFVTLSEIVK